MCRLPALGLCLQMISELWVFRCVPFEALAAVAVTYWLVLRQTEPPFRVRVEPCRLMWKTFSCLLPRLAGTP